MSNVGGCVGCCWRARSSCAQPFRNDVLPFFCRLAHLIEINPTENFLISSPAFPPSPPFSSPLPFAHLHLSATRRFRFAVVEKSGTEG